MTEPHWERALELVADSTLTQEERVELFMREYQLPEWAAAQERGRPLPGGEDWAPRPLDRDVPPLARGIGVPIGVP